MAELWASDDCAAWAGALDAYPAVVAAQGVTRLVELDAWYREELPGRLAAREPAHVTLEELARATEWKMKRGVWRARNLALVRGNDPGEVERTSAEALALVPEPRKPVTLLSRLAGVGPATASAVLAAARPDVYPFFDELIAAQVPDLGPVAFTPAYYARYAERLRERAAALATLCPEGGWTPHAVGQALWAASGGKVATGSGAT
jgi:hypothetical protein